MKLIRFAPISFLAAVATFCAVAAQAQTNLVVNIPGDNTCTTVTGEPGFNATSWTIGGSDASASGKSAVSVSLSALNITKNLDACSDTLIRDLVSGAEIPSMTLIQYRTAGSTPYAAATVTLTNALVSSWQVGGSASVVPSEAISFSFQKMCVATISLSSSGQPQPPQKVCYDAVNRIVS